MPKENSRGAGGDTYLHVWNKGFDSKTLFRTAHDYRHFIQCLVDGSKKYPECRVIGYVLLGGQYHLVLAEGKAGAVAEFMHWVNVSYAMYFNSRYAEKGKMFAGPYKSTVLSTSDEMMRLLAAIHMMPTPRCLRPPTYRWSSYPSYLKGSREWLHRSPALTFFACDVNELPVMMREFTIQAEPLRP